MTAINSLKHEGCKMNLLATKQLHSKQSEDENEEEEEEEQADDTAHGVEEGEDQISQRFPVSGRCSTVIEE